MWVVQIALRRPYTFVVVSFLIAIFGALAAVRTPTDIFPNINIPVVSVVWTYNGLLPNDMSGRVAVATLFFVPTVFSVLHARRKQPQTGPQLKNP